MAAPPRTPASGRIAIIVATRWELRALRLSLETLRLPLACERNRTGRPEVTTRQGPQGITILQSGIGPYRARQATGELLAAGSCKVVIAVGFASALSNARVADVLVGTEAVSLASNGITATAVCDPAWVARARASAAECRLSVHLGRIATADHVLVHVAEKLAARRASEAIGLDMESAAIGLVAAERRVPFLVTRTVSDRMDESLPVDFNLFLSRRRWLAGALSVMRPSALYGLWRLQRQAREASASLTAWFTRFLETV